MTHRPDSERHRSREAALQLLYQWEIGKLDAVALDEASRLFWRVHRAPDSRRQFAMILVKGTTDQLNIIDPLLETNAKNWRLSRMAVIDRLIMRMALYEMLFTDTPKAVVIDEALELAKTFSGDDAASFVNGILDAVSRRFDGQHESNHKDSIGGS
tara:strand:+ start:1907 stop:2374 length:468 start_codon:yes stop_codon:yes gene_type:complete